MPVLPRLVGNKGGGGEQIDLKGEDSRSANNEKTAERSSLPSISPSRCGAANQHTDDFNINR